MSKQCIFCEEKQNSKEHIFSMWLHEYLLNGLEHTKMTGQIGEVEGKQSILQSNKALKGNNILGIRVPAVCQTCNNGWMGTLEEGVQECLVPIILGNKININQNCLEKLQYWITLKLVILDYEASEGENRRRAFSDLENANFKNQRILPSSLRVWIARSSSPELEVLTQTICMNDDSSNSKMRIFFFGIGKLLVFAIYGSGKFSVAKETLGFNRPNVMIELTSKYVLSWPPKESVTVNDVNGYLDEFNQIVENLKFSRHVIPLKMDNNLKGAKIIELENTPYRSGGPYYADLVCPKCGQIICEGITEDVMRDIHPTTEGKLLIRCNACKNHLRLHVRQS